MRFLRSKYGVSAIGGHLLVLFLWRPGIYKLRSRIAGSIGSALGRRVALDNVRLRLLPRPGFDLEGLVIYDDPAFSAEPMIRAQEVSAAIRIRSLLRGRLEIANLSATEPSINLVRNDEGRWNLATLLERNAQIPAAPTGKAPSERRPAFPYLEASGARVNFKIGQTKKSYALTDAEVSLWQESENSWGARLRAEPVRTDFNLTDTGLLQINASWQRAATLRATPVQIAMQWQKGQLGQITKLLSGKDRGWRGGVNVTAKVSGTPEALRIDAQTIIEDFHRYDIADSQTLRLATACSGEYDAATGAFTDLSCESPVSNGTVRLQGTFAAGENPAYDLTLQAEKIPLASMVQLARQAKKQVPGDLTVTGLLNAEFHAKSNPSGSHAADRNAQPRSTQQSLQQSQQWTGIGAATNVRFSYNAGRNVVTLGTIPLALVAINEKTASRDIEQEPTDPHLRIGPVALSINGSPSTNAGGWISTVGYRFFLQGDMELNDLFRLENVLALPVMRPAAEGTAKLDVSVSGPWRGFVPPSTLGTAQLHNVRAEMHGLNTPIEIASAAISLTPEAVVMQKIVAHTGSTHWSGGITVPRHCAGPSSAPRFADGSPSSITNCIFQFDLTADDLSTGDLAEWFIPHPAKRPWYRILSPNSSDSQGLSSLLAIQAHGTLRVGRFELKNLPVTHAASQVDVDRGKITLTDFRGQLLRGTHEGNWIIDASNRDASNNSAFAPDRPAHPVRYQGAGALHDISLEQVGRLMNDDWIAGSADGSFVLDGSADGFQELLADCTGKLQFVMRNGSLPHVEIPGSSVPLPVHRFAGRLLLKQGTWELSNGRLESRDGIYQVRGTASPAGIFYFLLTRGDEHSWKLTGTIAKPHVVSRTELDHEEADEQSVQP